MALHGLGKSQKSAENGKLGTPKGQRNCTFRVEKLNKSQQNYAWR
jgi:hypothetical protein